jgi:hypothetical protein
MKLVASASSRRAKVPFTEDGVRMAIGAVGSPNSSRNARIALAIAGPRTGATFVSSAGIVIELPPGRASLARSAAHEQAPSLAWAASNREAASRALWPRPEDGTAAAGLTPNDAKSPREQVFSAPATRHPWRESAPLNLLHAAGCVVDEEREMGVGRRIPVDVHGDVRSPVGGPLEELRRATR